MKHRIAFASLLVVASPLVPLGSQAQDAPAPKCDMQLAFQQPDQNAPGKMTAVWTDAAGNLMFIEKLNVNTDGTRRSYSVDDFWGQTRALNNLCNAMSDACAGLDEPGLRARRIATQQAAAANWPADMLARTKISPGIIPLKDGKPCPAVDGFMVSATALHMAKVTDVCDLDSYVDALKTPALVIPKSRPGKPSQFQLRNVRVGDLAAAMRIDQDQPLMAVVGDTGPVDSLGEASIAMNGRLLGKTTAPVNYKEVKSWVVPRTLVLIFAGSRNSEQPYMSTDRIDPDAGERFKAWGGVARAKACIADYRKANPG